MSRHVIGVGSSSTRNRCSHIALKRENYLLVTICKTKVQDL